MSASSGGGDPDSNTNMDKPAEIVTVQYGDGKSAIGLEQGWNHTTHTRTKNYNNNYTMDANGQYASQGWVETVVDYDGDTASGGGWSDYVMSSTNPGVYYEHDIPDTGADSYGMGFIGGDEDSNYQITSVPDEDLDEMGDAGYTGYGDTGGWVSHYFADKVHWAWDGGGNHEDLTVGARIRQKLLTGGRGKSGLQNLFCISATGTVKNGEPAETSQWQGTQELGVDYTTIQVNGMNLGADGNLWVMEPDDAAPDVVVTIPGVRHFNACPGVQEYTLKIQVNQSAILSTVGVVAGAHYCVGQYLDFEPYWLPNDPPYIVSTSFFHWHLPGNYFNAETTPCPTCSTDPFVNADLLANDTTTAWWVSGGTPAEYTASVGMNLMFPNGQNASIAAVGKFNMYRPQAKVTAITQAVAVDSDYGTVVNGQFDGNQFALHYGSPESLAKSGIELSRTINTFGLNTTYSTDWVQVLNHVAGHRQLSNGTWVSGYGTHDDLYDVLDADPYSPSDPAGDMGDSPGIFGDQSSDLALTRIFDASTWLMFTPNGGHRVPLKRVDWHWSGTAINGLSWILTSQDNNANPPGVDTEAYPQWTNSASNFR
jgi:hypothetical protein